MLKPFGTCKLCESNSFLNYAGLCKRCNKKEASQEIIGEAVEKQKKALEAQIEMEKQKPVEPEEPEGEPASEEKTDETEDKAKEEESGDKAKEDEKDSK